MTTPLTYSRPGLEVVVVPLALRPPEAAAASSPGRPPASTLHVLLRPRDAPPYRGTLALPSAFVGHDTRLHVATRQALASSGVDHGDASTYDVGLFDAPDRDPRDRIIAIVRLALVRSHAAPSPTGAQWSPLSTERGSTPAVLDDAARPERLAFDHEALVAAALERLTALAQHSLAPLELLAQPFTLTAAQRAFEAALGRPLDKRNFRRKLETLGVLVPAGERAVGGRTPAKLFRLAPEAWARAAAQLTPPRP